MRRACMIVVLLVGVGGGCKGDDTDMPREQAETARHGAERAQAEAAKARAVAEAARKAADEAAAKAMRIVTMVDEARTAQMAIVDALAAAQSDAERADATAKLHESRRIVAELELQLAEAKAEAAKAERKKGVTLSPACRENPLAAGCR